MPLYADVRALVEETVVGVKSAGGEVDARMLDACRTGYEKSLFFCPRLADIKGLASNIREKVRHFDLVPTKDMPGSMSLLQAQDCQEALSLHALMCIQLAMKAICDNASSQPSLVPLADAIRRHFKHENILPPGSIIPAFFAPDPQGLKRFREMYCGSADRPTFSSTLMKGALRDRLAERQFLTHLEDGYATAHHTPGRYKLTERTARVLYERLEKLVGPNGLVDFEEFAPPEPQHGPRRGQISKALRVSLGNLL